MTDRPETSDVPETPEVAEVRRLLADARHVDPMPDDVVSRMEDVLAGLATSEPPRPIERDGVVLIDARRRRRAAALLVAAAAIVVGGVVIAPHLSRGGPSSAGSTADAAGGAAPDSTKGSPPGEALVPQTNDDSANSTNGGDTLRPAQSLQVRDGRVVIRPRRFSADALLSRHLLTPATADQFALKAVRSCPDVPTQADLVAAEYQRAPAALVYRRAQGGSQVVDLYVCGSPRPVRSTTLPAP
jgi:hypothetical protein